MWSQYPCPKARSAILAARKHLWSKDGNQKDEPRIYINEHLTTQTAQLFATARQMVKAHKISGSWTWNCKLFVKQNNGQVKCISTPSDLASCKHLIELLASTAGLTDVTGSTAAHYAPRMFDLCLVEHEEARHVRNCFGLTSLSSHSHDVIERKNELPRLRIEYTANGDSERILQHGLLTQIDGTRHSRPLANVAESTVVARQPPGGRNKNNGLTFGQLLSLTNRTPRTNHSTQLTADLPSSSLQPDRAQPTEVYRRQNTFLTSKPVARLSFSHRPGRPSSPTSGHHLVGVDALPTYLLSTVDVSVDDDDNSVDDKRPVDSSVRFTGPVGGLVQLDDNNMGSAVSGGADPSGRGVGFQLNGYHCSWSDRRYKRDAASGCPKTDDYTDPLLGSSPAFQRRLAELASLEARTKIWERKGTIGVTSGMSTGVTCVCKLQQHPVYKPPSVRVQ